MSESIQGRNSWLRGVWTLAEGCPGAPCHLPPSSLGWLEFASNIYTGMSGLLQKRKPFGRRKLLEASGKSAAFHRRPEEQDRATATKTRTAPACAAATPAQSRARCPATDMRPAVQGSPRGRTCCQPQPSALSPRKQRPHWRSPGQCGQGSVDPWQMEAGG